MTSQAAEEPLPGQTDIDEQIKAAQEQAVERGKRQNAAYSRASTRLRQAHRDEFDGYLAEEYAARGMVYRRRLTPEERAEAEKQERLAKAHRQVKKINSLSVNLDTRPCASACEGAGTLAVCTVRVPGRTSASP